MRIAFFTETFLPKVDGIVNTFCQLLIYLAQHNHQAIVFAPQGGPPSFAGAQVVGLPSVPCPIYPELRLVPPLVDVRRQIQAFAPDFIHLLNPVALGLSGLWLGKRLGLPIVASYHTDLPGFAERWGLGVFSNILWSYLRGVHNQAHRNLCPSRVTRAEVEAHGFERVKVWGRGVDTVRFNPARRSEEWRVRLSGGRPEAPLPLYVGRLAHEKRVHWLRPVLEAIPGARLAIVGDGPERSTLERIFVGLPATFLGYQRSTALAQAYAAADLFVFPAANETLGNVVLEAMASGPPVIAPRSGGLLDHVTDRQTERLFAPESKTELIELAESLVLDPAGAIALGRAGRAYAERHTWSAIFDGLLDDYRQVVTAFPSRHRLTSMPRAQTTAPLP